MKAIALHRPWDLFVFLGWKQIETRTHERFKSLVGLTIAIHSAKKIDPNWRETVAPYLQPVVFALIEKSILEGGKIHGTVEVWDHRALTGRDSTRAMVNCKDAGRFGLDLSFPRILREPLAVVGRQGIFYAPVPTDNHAYSGGSVQELLK